MLLYLCMSIKDIAAQLKVSKSTVSLVINGKAEQGRISEALAKRILDYVNAIGYKPNALAKSLATGKSRTIGLIVENIGDSFFGPIALHIEDYLRTHNYHVLYSSTLDDLSMANTILDTMLAKHVDGIIMAPTSGQKKKIQKLLEKNIPLVIFDRRIPSLRTNYIGTDNFTASKNAVQHLFDKGFKSIGMITIDSKQVQMSDRLRGYREVIIHNNATENTLQVPYKLDETNRKVLIEEFLKNNTFDALYFSTNYLCVTTLKLIKSNFQSNPYGMITFDDHEIFELNTPTISCIHQPIEEIANQIVTTLLKQIDEPERPYDDIVIPSKLVFRESTK